MTNRLIPPFAAGRPASAAALALASLAACTGVPDDGAASQGSYVKGYFALELDGADAGPIGGVGLPDSTLTTADRDFTVQMGLSMGQPVKDWIDASLATGGFPMAGAVTVGDDGVRHVREFHDALLTEIGFPAIDGSTPGDYLTIGFRVAADDVVGYDQPGGDLDGALAPAAPLSTARIAIAIDGRPLAGVRAAGPLVADMKQKMWHPTDFELLIDGIDQKGLRGGSQATVDYLSEDGSTVAYRVELSGLTIGQRSAGGGAVAVTVSATSMQLADPSAF